MSLITWEPFAEIDRVFNRMMPRYLRGGAANDLGAKFEWAPSADISETDTEFLIRAELPAVKKEDVKVTIEQGMLKIEGERKQRSEEKKERFHRVESFYGSFTRSFSLPDNVNVDTIRCETKDGVLTVHLPKTTQEEKPKQIPVQ